MKVLAELCGTWNGGTSPHFENLGCFIPYKEVIKQILVVECRKLMKAPQGLAAPVTPDFCLKTLDIFFSSSLFCVVACCKGQIVSQRVMSLESRSGFNSDWPLLKGDRH